MIFRAGVGRVDALSRIHAAAFEDGWSADALRALLDAGALALEAEDQGFVLLRTAADEAEILTLAVDPAARRRGLGRTLMAAGAAAAREAGAETFLLEVAADNEPALGLYRSFGFSACGHRPRYYARAGGPPVDALILKLALV